jgi:periplasmic copper chaperone A
MKNSIASACALLLLSGVILSACGSPVEPPGAAAPVATIGDIAISEPRVRTPPQGRDVTAGYLAITNTGASPARLVAASSPMASRVELHAHLTGPDGIKQMRQVNEVEVPAGGTALLAPGGLHLMLFGVKPDVEVGTSVPVSLTFDNGQTASFDMPVVENPVGKTEGDKGHEGHAH